MTKRSDELTAIRMKLFEIERKLDQLLEFQSEQQRQKEYVPRTLASLPNHLRKTAYTIAKMGEATAKQVADKTGRTRAAESDYLNQLASRGFLKKHRKKRDIYFQVFSVFTRCPQCNAKVPMTFDHCTVCGTSLVKTTIETRSL